MIFTIREHRSIVREVIFKHSKSTNIKELQSMTRIQAGMPLNPTLNQLACFDIAENLKKEGHYFANVRLEEGFQESDDRVVFNITEGPVVRVRNVSFVGQSELATGERLRTQIDTSRAILGAFGGRFNPAMVDSDVFKLEDYYKRNGYHKVHVSRELQFSDDFGFVDIVFHIQEGVRFRVYEYKIDGSKYIPTENLDAIPRVKKGRLLQRRHRHGRCEQSASLRRLARLSDGSRQTHHRNP